MSDEERIDNLIEAYSSAYGDWCGELNNDFLRRRMVEAEDALRAKIKSIITERDQLKKIVQSEPSDSDIVAYFREEFPATLSMAIYNWKRSHGHDVQS